VDERLRLVARLLDGENWGLFYSRDKEDRDVDFVVKWRGAELTRAFGSDSSPLSRAMTARASGPAEAGSD
jgi:hypothetical protein